MPTMLHSTAARFGDRTNNALARGLFAIVSIRRPGTSWRLAEGASGRRPAVAGFIEAALGSRGADADAGLGR